ncbi:DUF998 domain-containing protein [Thermoproteota archaeon]
MNVQQLIAVGGMIGPIIYTSIWILGGILQPDYNHIRDDVSSLMAVGAPNKRMFDIMQLINIILVITFFSSFHWAIDGGQGSIIGPACFVLTNLINIPVVLFYPLDEGGELNSSTAKMHFKLVMVMAVFGAAGMLAFWQRLSNTPGWVWYGTYSLITFIVTAITGVIASKTAGTEIMGLTERLVVTANVQYIFVLALKVFLLSA